MRRLEISCAEALIPMLAQLVVLAIVSIA
jgi:hypothetical protein